MAFPDVVSRAQWLEARKVLPVVRIEKEYVFGGPRGAVTLAGMFGGCRLGRALPELPQLHG